MHGRGLQQTKLNENTACVRMGFMDTDLRGVMCLSTASRDSFTEKKIRNGGGETINTW